MEHSINLLSSALGVCEDAGANAKTSKQRRKMQNRKNQREHRRRIREQEPASIQTPSPFQIRRWRLDEPDDCPSQTASLALRGTIDTYEPRRPPQSTSVQIPARSQTLQGLESIAQAPLIPANFIFPLSTDHLLHLIQYNVFRALVSNGRTLNTLLMGWKDKPPSLDTCPLNAPYRDDTMVYPLNPNIPFSLVPTRLQQTCQHSIWINLLPFPSIRDNLIRYERSFDHWDFLRDLAGENIGAIPDRNLRDSQHSITMPDSKTVWALPSPAGHDEDNITAGRKGLIVWGEPDDIRSWEATPGFLAKWSWAVEGCDDLIESSNRWRLIRGEESICRFESRS